MPRNRVWETLREVADALGDPVLIATARGRLLHRTPALCELLTQDQEAEAIHAAVEAMRKSLALHARGDGHSVHGRTPVEREVSTRARRRYLLRGSCHAFPGSSISLVVVRVKPLDASPRSEAELRREFSLTPMEYRVARLLAQGMSNALIAQELDISPHTARRHTERVLSKMEVRARAEVAGRLLL